MTERTKLEEEAARRIIRAVADTVAEFALNSGIDLADLWEAIGDELDRSVADNIAEFVRDPSPGT